MNEGFAFLENFFICGSVANSIDSNCDHETGNSKGNIPNPEWITHAMTGAQIEEGADSCEEPNHHAVPEDVNNPVIGIEMANSSYVDSEIDPKIPNRGHGEVLLF
jgi:hypothetical protein